MTVQDFNPNHTTTQRGPQKEIEKQSNKTSSDSKSRDTEAPKVGFVSLGCPKNTVDSERILTQLKTDGYQISSDYADSELVLVNTCGFIDSAVEESLESIGEALRENGKVIVTGCLGAKEDMIREIHPSVLAVTGPHAYDQVMQQVRDHLPKPEHNPFISLVPDTGVKLTPKHYAYLKISEGCNHRCTFCIIPSFRGNLDSRTASSVLEEAKRLADSGVKELLVISQDTSAYGLDLKYKLDIWNGRPVKTRMTQLCEALGELGVWVRLHYVYPYPHVDELIPLMKAGTILPYLDIPFQHASKKILKSMKRPAHSEKVLDRILKWREQLPELTIRSTFIVGFPGETEEDFEELLDFLRVAQLDRVGCFKYSPVEGATANDLPNQVDEAVKQNRWERFMAVQQEISSARLQNKVGTRIEVIVDEVVAEGAVCRSKGDAPEIDGQVFLDNQTHLSVGDILTVEVEEADEYDLWAHPV